MKALSARKLATLLGTPAADGPLYAWLTTELKTLITDGRVPIGVRLPAERELSAVLCVSRTTVTAAYRALREEGWSTTRIGAGSWTRLPQGTPGGNWVPAPFDERVIDLAHAASTAPAAVAHAYRAAMCDLPPFLHQHGYHPAGLPILRAAIAERYCHRGLPTSPDQILVTNGGIHALSIVLTSLLRPGDQLLVEHPSYPNALDTARALGARLLPVAIDPLDTDESISRIAQVLLEVRPAYAYLMPDVQNPTGIYLDGTQRRRLAAALRRAGCLPIVDETFADLVFDGQPASPFGAFGSDFISIGSLSKLFWGGMRVGWLRAPADMIQLFATNAVHSNPSGSVLEQLAASYLLPQVPAALTERRAQMSERYQVLRAALSEQLPAWQMVQPAGGFVAWCKLPGSYSTALCNAARRHGLRLAPGPRFGVGHAFEDRLRLPFVDSPEVLRRGVALLASADREVSGQGRHPTAAIAERVEVVL